MKTIVLGVALSAIAGAAIAADMPANYRRGAIDTRGERALIAPPARRPLEFGAVVTEPLAAGAALAGDVGGGVVGGIGNALGGFVDGGVGREPVGRPCSLILNRRNAGPCTTGGDPGLTTIATTTDQFLIAWDESDPDRGVFGYRDGAPIEPVQPSGSCWVGSTVRFCPR